MKAIILNKAGNAKEILTITDIDVPKCKKNTELLKQLGVDIILKTNDDIKRLFHR